MPTPTMYACASTTILAIGYDEPSQELHIAFTSGTYVYHKVPQEVYDEFMNAESIGKFFHSRIKKVYAGTKA